MLLSDAIKRFRQITRDTEEKYLWEDCRIRALLFDGQKQAAIRRRLLRDDTDPRFSRILFPAGQREVKLNRAIYCIDYADLYIDDTYVSKLEITDRDSAQMEDAEWRTRIGEPRFLVHDDTRVYLTPVPEKDSLVHLDVTRFPVGPDTAEFEVSEEHHEAIVWYAVGQAYLDSDSDAFDLERSRIFMGEFDRKYGPEVGAGMRRRARAGAPHRNRIHL